MKRRQAREIAIQSLYRIEMNTIGTEDAVHAVMEQIESEAEEEGVLSRDQRSLQYICGLVDGVLKHEVEIDAIIGERLQGWKLDRLSRVDLQVLRLAVYEMLYQEDVPPKVAVNEAVDLAKSFGTDDSGKFVNGVLGKVLKEMVDKETMKGE